MIWIRNNVLGFLLLLPLPSFGQTIHIDGAADLQLILCHRDALICNRSVRGDAVQELFGLDPRSGAELWRCRNSNDTDRAYTDGRGLYHETGGTLFKRNLTNGVVLWQTPLDSLPPKKPPFTFTGLWHHSLAKLLPDALVPDAAQLSVGRSTPPNHYGYSVPLLSGGKLLIARSATAGGGCIIVPCFEDWFLLDPDE